VVFSFCHTCRLKRIVESKAINSVLGGGQLFLELQEVSGLAFSTGLPPRSPRNSDFSVPDRFVSRGLGLRLADPAASRMGERLRRLK